MRPAVPRGRAVAVLAILEFQALVWNSRGESVRELMALLDTAARTTGEEREAAIAKIRESALAGFSEPPTPSEPGQHNPVAPS